MKKTILILIATIAFASNSYAGRYSYYNENVVYGQLEMGVGFSGSSSYSGAIGLSTTEDIGGYVKMGVISGDLDGDLLGVGITFGHIRDMTFYIGMGTVDYNYEDCSYILDECNTVTDGSDSYMEFGSSIEDSGMIWSYGMQLLPEDNLTFSLGMGFEFN